MEYEEQITWHWNHSTAADIVRTMIELPNGLPFTVFYRVNLIHADEDDNKFVDCAFAANVDYIVTEDHHYDVLKQLNFPRIPVINAEAFRQILLQHNLIEP